MTSIGWIPSADWEVLYEADRLAAGDDSPRAETIRYLAGKVREKQAAEQADEGDGL